MIEETHEQLVQQYAAKVISSHFWKWYGSYNEEKQREAWIELLTLIQDISNPTLGMLKEEQ